MSNDEDNYAEETDRRLALLGLALSESTAATGVRPDIAELWDFIHGAVSDTRTEEIESHLAADAELFSEWHTLQATTLELTQTETTAKTLSATLAPKEGSVSSLSRRWRRLPHWLIGSPWIATGGMAAVVGLLFIRTLNQTPPTQRDFWQEWSQPISTQIGQQDSVLRADLNALLAGVRARLIDLSFQPTGPSKQPLPEDVPECPIEDATCTQRRTALFSLGGLAVSEINQCQFEEALSVQPLNELQTIAIQVQSHEPLAILSLPVNRWIQASEQNSGARCAAAALVISAALPDE